MAPPKVFSFLALALVAILVLTAAPPSVDALNTDRFHVARSPHQHDALVHRKRDNSSTVSGASCKPRTSSSSSTSSASSATPSATPSSSTGKKWGLAWPNGDADYLTTFASLPDVQMIYTWSPYLPTDISGLTGVPMLWGYDQITDFQSLVVKGYANYVLGMNEPNEPSQSNMSPKEGATLWQQYIDPLKNIGYYLVSPACTNDQSGLDWMAQFFQACTGCTFDAIAFHFYGTDAQAFISYATQLHDTYGKNLWATELADQDYSGANAQATQDEVNAFAATIANFVDNTSWMEYAFPFGVMSDLQGVNTDNSLLSSNNQPTDLAHTYFG